MFDPYPKYQNGLPGHDWDIVNLKFDQANIQMIENDILALLRYSNGDSRKLYDSWLFMPGLIILTDEKTDLANRFYDKMKNSGSWILSVTAEYVALTRVDAMQTFMLAIKEMQGEPYQKNVETFADRMLRKVMRGAVISRENEILTLIIKNLEEDNLAGDMHLFIMK